MGKFKSYRKQAQADFDKRKQAKAEAIGIFGVSAAQSTAPVGKVDGGNYKQSFGYDTDSEKVRIGNSAHYGLYLEYGTGKYAEKGDGRKTPWFYKDEKGEWHYTEGIKPFRTLRNAVEGNIGAIKAIMRGF